MAQTAFCDGHKNAKTSSSPLLPTSYQRGKERGAEWAKEREIQRSILVSPFFFFKQMSTFWPFEIQTGNFYVCSYIFFFFSGYVWVWNRLWLPFRLELEILQHAFDISWVFLRLSQTVKRLTTKAKAPKSRDFKPLPLSLVYFSGFGSGLGLKPRPRAK